MTMEKIEEKYCEEVLGSRVRYLTHGSGQPIIFISGWMGTAENFTPMFKLFPEGYQCIALDLPGFGKSTLMTGGYEVGNYAAFLKAFIDKEKIVRPALVGVSMGASIVLAYAAEYGNADLSIILQSPVYKPFEIVLMAKIEVWVLENIRPVTKLILALTRYRTFQKLVRLTGDTNVKSVSEGYLSEYGLKSLYRTDPKVLVESLKSIMSFDFREHLYDVKAKILLVYGSKENMLLPEYQNELHAALPGCEFVIIEEGTHYAMMQKPQEFTGLIVKFLGKK